jgi:hypothetical protein
MMVAPLLYVVLLAAQYISASVLHQLETVPQTIASNVDKRQALPKASWGHTVYLDAKASEWIYMSVIYSPGKPPANPKGSLFLWPGLFERENYQRSNLIQTVTELHSPAENRQVCGAKPGQWYVIRTQKLKRWTEAYNLSPLGVFARLLLTTV